MPMSLLRLEVGVLLMGVARVTADDQGSCWWNSTKASPLGANAFKVTDPCTSAATCKYLCINSKGTPSTLEQEHGSWACRTQDGSDAPGSYQVYQDGLCGPTMIIPTWFSTQPDSPLPFGLTRIYTGGGQMACRVKSGNDDVGDYYWNDLSRRWECIILNDGRKTSKSLIPDVEVLIGTPWSPPGASRYSMGGAAMAGKVSVPTKEVAPGIHIPMVNIGTWTSDGHAGEQASAIVGSWLGQGGRGIDTALVYMDQAKVAKAIADAGVSRKDVFITTKIPGCGLAQAAIDADLKQLNTDYIDLLLIHEPVGFSCANTWKVLEANVKNGKLKSIGVSNFKTKDLQGILKEATIKPAVNQILYNVFAHDEDTMSFCHANNITVEAFSPLAPPYSKKSVFKEPTVTSIAKAHNVSQVQVALKWIVQRGDILTVLSSNPEHQASDADLWSFTLSDDEMTKLGAVANASVIV